jgi:hypothetical protein
MQLQRETHSTASDTIRSSQVQVLSYPPLFSRHFVCHNLIPSFVRNAVYCVFSNKEVSLDTAVLTHINKAILIGSWYHED